MTKATGRKAMTDMRDELEEVADLVERRGILSIGSKAGVLIRGVRLIFEILIDLTKRVEALESRDGK